MSILIDETTRVVIQGITGGEGAFHGALMREYGTNVVAGVTPGKGGITYDGVPVFNTVDEAVRETGADCAAIFVRPPQAADAIMEAAGAGIGLVVCMTEGIPTLDMVLARRFLDEAGSRLVGPNTPGVISPGRAKVGVMAGYIHRPGRVGVISRSGTLTYEAVLQLTGRDIGQSTCVGVGGDPLGGLSFTDLLALFEEDDATDAVLMIGEIGGSQEEEAAGFARARMTKPLVAYIAGVTAPPSGAWATPGPSSQAERAGPKEKIAALENAGRRGGAQSRTDGRGRGEALRGRGYTKSPSSPHLCCLLVALLDILTCMPSPGYPLAGVRRRPDTRSRVVPLNATWYDSLHVRHPQRTVQVARR
jgi:succinyl-CoA synthetase alpha subunit